jgi:hypothetical protein
MRGVVSSGASGRRSPGAANLATSIAPGSRPVTTQLPPVRSLRRPMASAGLSVHVLTLPPPADVHASDFGRSATLSAHTMPMYEVIANGFVKKRAKNWRWSS